jgi:endoglucanase
METPQTGRLNPAARRLLDELLLMPSPTGSEQRIQRLIRDRMSDVAQSIEPDLHGNLILGVHTDKRRRVMLAGHCDQLGFVIKYISPSGYLYLDALGGVDYGVLPGEHVTIHTRGGPVRGVFGRKPIHLQSSSEMNQVPPSNQMWVDIGATNEDEARQHVRLGDYLTVDLKITELLNNRIVAPGLDNKAGLLVCLETLRRVANEDLNVAVYVVSTVQEEIGSRGAETAAFALNPEVGIAVDVVNATDDPGPSSPQQQVQCKIGGGPALASGPGTNPIVHRLLSEAIEQIGISQQPAPSGKAGGNDSKPIQVSRGGIAAGSVGIPQRNMHTQAEMCSLDDIEDCIQLLVQFLKSIDDQTDFRPINDGD